MKTWHEATTQPSVFFCTKHQWEHPDPSSHAALHPSPKDSEKLRCEPKQRRSQPELQSKNPNPNTQSHNHNKSRWHTYTTCSYSYNNDIDIIKEFGCNNTVITVICMRQPDNTRRTEKKNRMPRTVKQHVSLTPWWHPWNCARCMAPAPSPGPEIEIWDFSSKKFSTCAKTPRILQGKKGTPGHWIAGHAQAMLQCTGSSSCHLPFLSIFSKNRLKKTERQSSTE